jgi:membrane protein DedA with SNARE-associated domain
MKPPGLLSWTAPMPLALTIDEILRDLGYLGLALLTFAEVVFPPIPSEAILPLGGYLVGQGELQFAWVMLAGTAGSLAGSMLLYELARRGGRPFAERFLTRARVDHAHLDRAEAWFARRGGAIVLLGRCVPGVRSVVALPAGMLRMGRVRYLLLTLAGTLAWNGLLVGAGWILGHEWERVSDVVGAASRPLLLGAVAATAVALTWVALRARRAGAARPGDLSPEPPPPTPARPGDPPRGSGRSTPSRAARR